MKIALIAHDKKKEEMIELSKKYREVLAEYELYATGTTGTLIMGETGLKICRMKSGPLGGDQQIGAMLANGELGLIVFLRDPLTAQPHEPDVRCTKDPACHQRKQRHHHAGGTEKRNIFFFMNQKYDAFWRIVFFLLIQSQLRYNRYQ